MQRSAAVLLALAFAACGGGNGTNVPAAPSPGVAETGEAVARVGDVSVRASVVQTSTLDEAVAREYGITRDPGTVLLLVAVRQGPDASAVALSARISATATDLRGGRQDIAMRALKTGDPGSGPGRALLDYVGIVTTTLPDTLRFDITVVREGGATSTLQITREFYPR